MVFRYSYRMKPRRRTKKKPAAKKNTELSRKIRHLEVTIKYSKRSMDGKGGELDQLFSNQVAKAEAELQKLKENQ